MEVTFNSISDVCAFSRQSQVAHITLIYKDKKDPAECSSYCPISLINVDLKIYAKLLADRLPLVIPSIISLDQVGFLPACEAQDNTIKIISLISHCQSQKIPLCLLSLDAEKAFDRLDWALLKATLEQIGLFLMTLFIK